MECKHARILPLAAIALAACGGVGVSFEAGVVHAPNGVAFRVGDVPSGWHRVDVQDAALAFRDEHGGSVLVNARCGLRSDDIPLVALTNQLIIGTTDREYISEEVIPFDQREARHMVMRAKLDGVTLMWDAYVMKKDGCVYDLAFVAPVERFEQESAAFDRFATGLRTLPKGGS